MNNATIAGQFSLLSKLLDIHGENSFKSKSYSIAAYHIDKLPIPLAETERSQIAQIKGLGPSVAAKIIELLDTGNLQIIEQYINRTPAGVLDMLSLKGIGPKKIHIIWKEMGIESIGELEYACNENRLTRYKGFGEKTQENVLQSIKFYNQNVGHFLYAQVDALFPSMENYLKNLFGKDSILPTGTYRRQCLTLHELAFIIRKSNQDIKPKFATAYPPELIEETKTSLLYKLNNGLCLRLFTGEENIYKKQFLTSASPEFLEEFFTIMSPQNFDESQPASEGEIFEQASLPYIQPCLRETKNILQKAASKNLPTLIETADIRGSIHNHTNWSDGSNTIEEMAASLIENKFEYLVISDHSKTAAYANGLSVERIQAQHQYIDMLNEKLKPFKIFKSIESDILNDGSLDYCNDVLQRFDLVIASIHSNLYMSKDKAMMRLLKAIENPYTTILGHPTGRLLLSRNGYSIDHETIIDACVANNVAIEINANPHRLDLDWKWIDYAISKNAILSVNPDAHSIEGLYDIKYGVLASQKGGLTAACNLSSYTLGAFEYFLSSRLKNI